MNRYFALLAIVSKFIATKIRTNPMAVGALGTGAGIVIEKQLDEDDDTKDAIDVVLGDLGSDDREKLLTLANGLVSEAGNVWVDPKIRTGELTAEYLIVPIGENSIAAGKSVGIWHQVYGKSALRKANQRGWSKANRSSYRKKR